MSPLTSLPSKAPETSGPLPPVREPRRAMASWWVALGCLTILPCPRGTTREADFDGSFLWFPAVGLLIGLLLVGIHWAAALVFPPLVVGALVLLGWIALTGALHLDGLGDVCDGLYGGRTPEERLRIMKDPQAGAMAVVAVSGLLLLKFALLSSLAPAAMDRLLLLSVCAGRYAMVLLGTTLPYARLNGGTGAAFVRAGNHRALATASLLTALIAWGVLGWPGVGLLAAAALGTGILRQIFRKTLGGVTGDAFGAAGELIETLVLLLGVALAATLSS